MPSFVVLGKFTEQGAKDVKNVKSRVEATKEAMRDAGGRMIFYYMTLGEYDFVVVTELPDAETAARVLMTVGASGNVRTTTMQAFTEDETWALADALP